MVLHNISIRPEALETIRRNGGSCQDGTLVIFDSCIKDQHQQENLLVLTLENDEEITISCRPAGH